jgi:hypothetical protein
MIPRDRVFQWVRFGGAFGLSRKFQPPCAQDLAGFIGSSANSQKEGTRLMDMPLLSTTGARAA